MAIDATMEFREELVGGWGMAVQGRAHVLRPTSAEQVAAAMTLVRRRGGTLALRGAGCTYGDAPMNRAGSVLDPGQMRRILAFDPRSGVISVEPGVTIRDLWRHAISYGFWPPVVPGTSAVSVGGATAMNIHGKNNFAVGPFGEHVESFVLETPGAGSLRCSREQNADVFHAAISGFGMLGCFTEITVRLKRVHSGRLRVRAIVTNDLAANLRLLEDLRGTADYLVGWIDLHATGAALGRGTMHRADQLAAGEDPEGLRYFDPALQDVPARLFGVVPKGWLWPGLWAAVHLGQVRDWRPRSSLLAVSADVRCVPLPARLRAALAVDDAPGRPHPVPTVRAPNERRARAADADRALPAGRHRAVSRGAEAAPSGSFLDDARRGRLLAGDGLLRQHEPGETGRPLAPVPGAGGRGARRRRPLLLRQGRRAGGVVVQPRPRGCRGRDVPRAQAAARPRPPAAKRPVAPAGRLGGRPKTASW